MKNTRRGGHYDRRRRRGNRESETVHIVRPNHLNAAGRLFGGILMQWIDEVAGMVAIAAHPDVILRRLRWTTCVYQRGISTGSSRDHGKSNLCGNHIHGSTRRYLYEEDTEGMRRPINRAYFTMVALDENDKPCPVPKLLLESGERKQNGKQQRNGEISRKKRKEEGF